jgi:hypothetical protein
MDKESTGGMAGNYQLIDKESTRGMNATWKFKAIEDDLEQ